MLNMFLAVGGLVSLIAGLATINKIREESKQKIKDSYEEGYKDGWNRGVEERAYDIFHDIRVKINELEGEYNKVDGPEDADYDPKKNGGYPFD